MSGGFRTISPHDRRLAAQLAHRAQEALKRQQFDYAVDLLRQCCELDPADLTARKRLRQTQRARIGKPANVSAFTNLLVWLQRWRLTGKPELILARGEKLLSRHPWDVGTQLAMAKAADKLGLADTAISILEMARVGNLREPRINRLLAQILERHGFLTRAIPLWQLVAEVVPEDPEASRKVKDLAANHALAAGDYANRALDEATLSKLCEHDSSGDQARNAAVPAERLRLQEISKLREQIALQPERADAYLRLAALLREKQEYEAAREVLEQGLQATHRHFEIQMALVDLEIDPYRENLRLLRRQLREHPDDPQLRQQEVQWEKEILARELAYFRQRADCSSADGRARIEVAVRLRRLGKPKDAILELEPLKNHEHWGWKAQVELAECYVMRQQPLLARKHLEDALARLPPESVDERAAVQQRLAEILSPDETAPSAASVRPISSRG
jgi:tetratricopeptide (TPR) repeat protein